MINIRFGVIKDNLKLLNSILGEAVNYGIWSVFYGDEEISTLKSLKGKVAVKYEESISKDQGSYPLELSFKEGQIFKKVIVFYLTNNFKNLSRKEFETITDFILFVDDSLAFELEEI
ncbi:hypothetical protein [Candidatus Clostridium stratigraminis]|uniref:Uncharacterized protein n=1 Tax=Candidatus Clostridium stratigraminis TaxID=3381661 RepID=A0ABW8T6Y5_9CLOT